MGAWPIVYLPDGLTGYESRHSEDRDAPPSQAPGPPHRDFTFYQPHWRLSTGIGEMLLEPLVPLRRGLLPAKLCLNRSQGIRNHLPHAGIELVPEGQETL